NDAAAPFTAPVKVGNDLCFGLASAASGFDWLEAAGPVTWGDLGNVRVVRAGEDGHRQQVVVESLDPSSVVSAVDWAHAADGLFVVVWSVDDGAARGRVRARLFAADGNPQSEPLELGPSSLSSSVRVAGASGRYVAVWLDGDAGGPSREVILAAF